MYLSKLFLMFAKIKLISMKKAFALFAITVLSVGILSARKPDHVSVVSGNVKILGEKETLCSVKFDYSNTQVEEKP